MPSVKMPKKSTDTDMTPFVDVAFLILSFFMLATKFKPPEPVEVKMPTSVSAEKLKQTDAIWLTIDKESRVFFSVTSQKTEDNIFAKVANNINNDRKLNLTNAELANLESTLKQTYPVGVPFVQLKQILALPPADQAKVKQPGIPVTDSATNEMVWWITAAKNAFAGKKGVLFLIKGDGESKYPTFGGVIDALKRNNELKYHLITDPEGVPTGSALEAARTEELNAQ